MHAPDYCSVHLGPNGLEYKTTDSAIAEFKAKMQSDLIKPLTLAERVAAQRELSAARFYSLRDGAHKSRDVMDDPDASRRRRGLSITRDMMHGPGTAQNVLDLSTGLHSRTNIGAGVDRDRFLREADGLRMRRIFDEKDLPDWTSDQSIVAFFGSVYDKALEEACSGQPGVNRVIDAAPGIFLFTELLKRTEKLIEEDFTELWARRIFPILNLNTWLPQWHYERIDDRTTLPNYVDTEQLPSAAPRGSENRSAVLRPLAFWHHAASWSNIELMRYAEAVANGAPNIKLDQRRINAAIRMMNYKEDLLAFFGDPDLNIQGLFSAEADTGIERVASGGIFGSGTTEADRQLLTREVKLILENTEQALRPDTLMLSTASWLYVNDTRYGDATNASNQTVLEAAEYTLRKFGIRDIMWVPEVGYSAAQEARLSDHGVPAADAARLAGGLSSQQTMVVMKRDPEVCEMVVAKDRVMYPARETVADRVEARMLQGGGGMVFYKPEAIKIVTNVGP